MSPTSYRTAPPRDGRSQVYRHTISLSNDPARICGNGRLHRGEAKLTERGLGMALAQKTAEDVSEIVDAVVQR
jgi:hypothetical protein